MLDAIADRYVATPSGLLLPEKHAISELKRAKRPVAVDLFCGCGGFSLGLKQAGWEVIAAADKWPTALITYATNLCRWGEMEWHFVEDEDAKATEREMAASFKRAGYSVRGGEIVADGKLGGSVPLAGTGWIQHQPRSTPGTRHLICGDIAKLTGERLLEIIGMQVGELDAIVGGPPCQGYCVAGQRDPKDPRNNLVFEFARLVVETRPKTMVMENVPGITSMVTPDGLPVLDVFCKILEDGGFGGVDAMRRAMAAQGSFGLINRKGAAKAPKMKRQKAPPPPAAPVTGQLALFEAAD
jgi:DNA (cytosine-5)-methyltransferase 1